MQRRGVRLRISFLVHEVKFCRLAASPLGDLLISFPFSLGSLASPSDFVYLKCGPGFLLFPYITYVLEQGLSRIMLFWVCHLWICHRRHIFQTDMESELLLTLLRSSGQLIYQVYASYRISTLPRRKHVTRHFHCLPCFMACDADLCLSVTVSFLVLCS